MKVFGVGIQSMAGENGDNSADTSQGVKRDFKLTALVTQLNELSAKIVKVENQCKSQVMYIPPHDKKQSRDMENNRVEETLQIILQKITKQDPMLEEMTESIEVKTTNVLKSTDWRENGQSVNRRRDMVRSNLTEPPYKKAKGITINEEGSNPSKMRGDDLQPRHKGKRKKHIARKGAAIEPDFPEPEDEQPLINRRDALRARSQPTATSTPSVATPPTTNSVPAQASSVTPALPIVPPPRLLNRLKGDGLRTIIKEKLLPMEGLEGKHSDVLETLRYHGFEQFTQPRGPFIPS
uniref:Integrase core domain containing protein n=1 Tax=Solanum tuberosum TaxID=4113 RepID=M1DDG8_SOLTU